MKNKNIFFFLLLTFILLGKEAVAQDRFEIIKNELQILAMDNPGLENTVEISVNGVSLQEFLRGIAITNELNISVDNGLDVQIVNNFSNVSVAEVLLFLAQRYQLKMDFIGNIISISSYVEPQKEYIPPPEKELKVDYSGLSNTLSLDLDNDELDKVVRKITNISGKNVILSPEVENKKVSTFILNMPFDNAIEKFAFANGMQAYLTQDGFYLLSNRSTEGFIEENAESKDEKVKYKRENIEGLFIAVQDFNNISISAEDAPIDEIVKALASELDVDFYLYNNLQGNKSLNLNNASFDEILLNIFESTSYTYKKTNGIYLIGERVAEGLRKTTVYQFQNRSVENILTAIPTDLKKEVELKEFVDLNSIVISGSQPLTEELLLFLKMIDQLVPVVAIDVIIIDYRKNRSVTTGVSAGLGKEPSAETYGQILPEANFSFSASSLNNIIGSINEGSTINLGKVTPNFYLSVQALETDGILRVRSTPKIATLNGHEASLSIGNTEYYIEESNNVIGSQNPQNIITRIYRPIKADLSVKIKPFVSGNDQITLEITVEQSDFTERIADDAPPGSVTRSFTSMLRVKNNEIVLLGGLEEKSRSGSGVGLPFIARIPILKWIFGRRTQAKNKSQLNIFIKPTVIY